MVISVTHTSHGFDSGDLGKPMRSSGTNGQFVVARANSAANAEVVGVLTSVEDTNNYTITSTGIVDVAAAIPDAATAGQVLFVSQTADTVLTTTEPTAVGEVSKPVAVIIEQNAKMLLIHYRGEVITSTTQTNAPNDAQYVTLAVNGDLSAERVLTAGSGITLTDAGANGAATISIANDAIDSQHYAAGSIDLEHMSSQSVDEDNLHISNAGNDGEFLSKQSGNAGGLTWAAVSSAVTRKGGNTSEESETGTSEADIMTIASLSIAATSPWKMTALWRKGSGAASAGSGGLKIVADSTVTVGASTTAATLWQSGTSNQAEDGGCDTNVGAKATNYLTSNSQNNIVARNSSNGGFTYGNVGTVTKDAIFPLGTISSLVLTASNGASNMSTHCDEVHVYSWAVS